MSKTMQHCNFYWPPEVKMNRKKHKCAFMCTLTCTQKQDLYNVPLHWFYWREVYACQDIPQKKEGNKYYKLF
jgi:hypothetical protein